MLDNHNTGVAHLQHDAAAALKWHDVTRWSHSQKQVRGGLDDAAAAACPNCAGRFYVWAAPANADRHARQIRRFIQRHSHAEGGT